MDMTRDPGSRLGWSSPAERPAPSTTGTATEAPQSGSHALDRQHGACCSCREQYVDSAPVPSVAAETLRNRALLMPGAASLDRFPSSCSDASCSLRPRVSTGSEPGSIVSTGTSAGGTQRPGSSGLDTTGHTVGEHGPPEASGMFRITAFVNWTPRESREGSRAWGFRGPGGPGGNSFGSFSGGSSSSSSGGAGMVGDSIRWCCSLLPFKRISSLSRAILTLVLLLLATQQLLFLRSVDMQHSIYPDALASLRGGSSLSGLVRGAGSREPRLDGSRRTAQEVHAGHDLGVDASSGALWRSRLRLGGGHGWSQTGSGHEGLSASTSLQAVTSASQNAAAAAAAAASDAAAASAREWVQEMRLCMTTARALLQMAEDSGDENMVASARQEMDQCMALLSEPASAALPYRDPGKAGLSNQSRVGDSQQRRAGASAGATPGSLGDRNSQVAAGTAGAAGHASSVQLETGGGAHGEGSADASGLRTEQSQVGAQLTQQVQGRVTQDLTGLSLDGAQGGLEGGSELPQERTGEQSAEDPEGVQRAKRQEALRRLEEAFRLLLPPSGPITVGSTMGGAAAVLAAASGTVGLSSVGSSMASPGLVGSGVTASARRKAVARDSAGITRLKRKLEASEQQTRAVLLQSMLYSQLAAKSVPRGLHCLALRLTLAWNSSPSLQHQAQDVARGTLRGQGEEAAKSWAQRMTDPTLFHYALFSDNVLAVAVVVNSTAQHMRDPTKHVMHIVTDRMNLAAIRAWLALNPPAGGQLAHEVLCLEDFQWLNASFVPVLRQREMETIRDFYYRPISAATHTKPSSPSAAGMGPGAAGLGQGAGHGLRGQGAGSGQRLSAGLPGSARQAGAGQAQGSSGGAQDDYMELKYRNPKYMSILNHLRFYLPLVFPNLTKVLFLDDDVVVQKDLSPLWEIPMHGNVNLAVETCGKTFHRFKTYLNFSNSQLAGFDPEGCAWAFGMNLFDLHSWRQHDFTRRYHYWQQQNENRTLWKLGTLPAGLLAFYNATQVLEDRSWHVLGLGSKRVVSLDTVRRAGVVHWNGHAKPWLDLANPLYQPLWTKYVPYENEFLRQCNIEPPKPFLRPARPSLQILQILQRPSPQTSQYLKTG